LDIFCLRDACSLTEARAAGLRVLIRIVSPELPRIAVVYVKRAVGCAPEISALSP
jgi:hypothetical protein